MNKITEARRIAEEWAAARPKGEAPGEQMAAWLDSPEKKRCLQLLDEALQEAFTAQPDR